MSSKSSVSSKECWCKNCEKHVISNVVSETTRKNKLLNLILCPFGYCFIPYELQKFRNNVHKCPVCNKKINNFEKEKELKEVDEYDLKLE